MAMHAITRVTTDGVGTVGRSHVVDGTLVRSSRLSSFLNLRGFQPGIQRRYEVLI